MDNFILNITSSGSSTTLVKQTMGASPRLFSGSDLYIYNIFDYLYKVVNLESLTNIIPDNVGFVPAMTSIVNGTTSDTLVFCAGSNISTGDLEYTLKYTAYPEPTNGIWSSGSTLPTSFAPVDSISDYAGAINALTGNSHAGTEYRIITSSGSAPYPMSKSDTGMPTTSVLTDLEMAE
jgi:hypothetical protein